VVGERFCRAWLVPCLRMGRSSGYCLCGSSLRQVRRARCRREFSICLKIKDVLHCLTVVRQMRDRRKTVRHECASRCIPSASPSYSLASPPYSSCRISSSSFGLCFTSRPWRGSVSMARAGLGWPTRSRALALTALAAENLPGLRFVILRMSMEEVLPEWKPPPAFGHRCLPLPGVMAE